ncbi:hypothetical protein Q5H93_18180 [Hymenobacter sp. ASUV-10]|uniref:Restriction endonuclease n=1 Tax=Hymenobacter aranciens TaxID=3063996 RepID=A0ABT9BEI8_9BACT|nr:hypothetical protein [Hymenobacter sp. ASUV-10]MDO7876679.1 hypothetical protein [Hymenobacter sp. ASUV-10]
MVLDITKIEKATNSIATDLDALLNSQCKIKDSLLHFSDGKNLKGDELTGWLGEIFAKILFNGTLVDESHEHDFIVPTSDEKYAVKARKGKNKGWNITSAISKIEGGDCPDFLLFIHFDTKYSIESIWKYNWKEILAEKRFKPKKVRGEGNRWYFQVTPTKDKARLVYSRKT